MKRHNELKGDGGSGVIEQVIRLRKRMSARLSAAKHIIAIGSGKGGVGKSTLVMQIATILQSRNYRVGILDADINGPSQVRLGGLHDTILVPGPDGLCPPKTKLGIPVLSFGSIYSEENAVTFESVAKGDMHTWRATKEFSTLVELLTHTDWGELDFLLIDLPPGAERTVQFAEFFAGRAQFILVTTPADMSQGVVRRSLVALRETSSPIIGLIENMSGYYCACCDEVKQLFPNSTQEALPLRKLGVVPFDPALAELCDRGKPITELPHSPATLAISSVCDHILQSIQSKSVQTDKEERDEVLVC